MSRFTRYRCARLTSVAALVFSIGSIIAAPGQAATLLSEQFTSDPIAGGRAVVVGNPANSGRFTYSSTEHTLTAAYNTLDSTNMLRWSLDRTLTQHDSFSYSASFTISNLQAADNQFAQIAFGLVNSTTTGFDRSGTGVIPTDTDDAFNILTMDYFPNVSSFAAQTLEPTLIASDDGDAATDAFAGIHFPFGPESDLRDESPLPENVTLTTNVSYDAATGEIVLRVSQNGIPLNINLIGDGKAVGGSDGDITTITTNANGAVFSFDSFALTLWQDSFSDPVTPSVQGDVAFSDINVTVAPEPGMLLLILSSGGMLLMLRRRSKRHVV